MLRRFTLLLVSLLFCCTTVACSSPQIKQSQPNQENTSLAKNQVRSGEYPVQQATYDDVDGSYTLMLLNTPSGNPPTFTTTDLQMARLTDEEIESGKGTYVNINGEQGVMHLTQDFRIEYVHNVTETQNNPQTGQAETVVVRRESSFWRPFAGAVAGQLVANALFAPRYYVPPIYQPGVVLTGYGGYGNTYSQAVNSYQERHKTPPPVVKNRQNLRTTGNLRTSTRNSPRKSVNNSNRSTGSGFGSSNLRQSNQPSTKSKRSTSGFGSSSRRSTRSFSRRRRR